MQNRPIDYRTLPDAARLRERQILPVIGRSRASLWRDVRKGTFPKPKRHGVITSWRWSDVRAWLEKQDGQA